MKTTSTVSVVYPKAIPVTNGERSCFLAGPIRNAPPWHEDAIDILMGLARREDKLHLRVYCPKRFSEMDRSFADDMPPTSVDRQFTRQRDWEFETQELSVREAGVLFWLVREGEKRYPEKVYGAITQEEFGFWLARASVDQSLRIAFGTDGHYNGELRTMTRSIERLAPWLLPMHTSLESLCGQAIMWAKEDAGGKHPAWRD